jgi:hypothetical protein
VVDPTTFAPAGERRPAEATFGAAPGADATNAGAPGAVAPDSLIIAAARLGATRLLDNVAVGSATGDSGTGDTRTGDSATGDSGDPGLKHNSNAAGDAATTREKTTPHEPDPRGGPASAKED